MKNKKRKPGRPKSMAPMKPILIYVNQEHYNKLHNLPGGQSIASYVRAILEKELEGSNK